MYDFDRSLLRAARRVSSVNGEKAGTQVNMQPVGVMEKPLDGTRFIRLRNADEVGQYAAQLVAEQLEHKPNCSIVFPTGKTPLPMYAALRHMPELHWESARLFQLDEYIRPPVQGPLPYETFAEFMNRELWDYIGGKKHYIQHYFGNPEGYERKVLADGGPDLVILGIGTNGHVAFNEPGSEKDSPTRIIDLTEETLFSNFGYRHFEDAKRRGFPTQALTMGLHAILAGKHILLLALGEGKHAIVKQAFNPAEPPSEACPASWLKLHPQVTVVTDFEV